MKILISGGAGFIGRKLCEKLNNSHEVIVLDNFLDQIHGTQPYEKIPNVKYIVGDVTNYSDWELALNENPDCIIHLAAETGTGQSMDEIVRYVNTNVIGTSILYHTEPVQIFGYYFRTYFDFETLPNAKIQ